MPITVEARRDFVQGIVPLSFWMADTLARGGEAFASALTNKTPVYRLTTLYDGKRHPSDGTFSDPKWNALVAEFEAIRARGAGDAYEKACTERCWPLLEGRIASDAAEWPELKDWPFGFWRYDLLVQDPAGATAELHLANPFAPESPFKDVPARARELARLLADATARCPDLKQVRCGSWLNSFAPFLAFFPEAYAKSAQARPLVYSKGWWGQFIDRAGNFHRRNGEQLRATGRFPFESLTCACGTADLKKHLKEKFGLENGDVLAAAGRTNGHSA